MGAGVSLSRRRPRRCVRTAGICQINVQMLLAVSPFASRCWRASPSPVPKMPNSPSSALLNSNGGQIGDDPLRGAPRTERKRAAKGPFRWFPDRGYFPALKGAPPPFSRRIVFRNRRTPQIGPFTIRGCHIWKTAWKIACKEGRRVACVVGGSEGCPQMMKIHESGLAICMDRAGVASRRNLT
jgi:hypothetical protein